MYNNILELKKFQFSFSEKCTPHPPQYRKRSTGSRLVLTNMPGHFARSRSDDGFKLLVYSTSFFFFFFFGSDG